ncbi:hypothetical protein D0C16_05545 [Cellvibrio sp. KY-GH-1]|nr:hypothetical protein D0C16_05545 [Cellvibrio sp. KY-GH-1]
MNWSWSAEEDAAMDYLPHAAQVLYLRVLRRRMDFNTGVVGITCRLSYKLIGEWLEVRPPAKSTKPIIRLTVQAIRTALEQLEKAGLIKRVESDGEVLPLVFLLPFARTGLIREKYEQQDEQQQGHVRATAIDGAAKQIIKTLFLSNNSSCYQSKSAVDNLPKTSLKMAMSNSKKPDEQQDEQQTSGMSSLGLINNISTARGNNCLIADDWLPGIAVVEQVVIDFGLPPVFIKRKAIEFRILWREQNVIALDWDRYFYGACKNKISEADGEFLSAIKNNRRPHAG